MLVKPFVATIREISNEFGTPVLYPRVTNGDTTLHLWIKYPQAPLMKGTMAVFCFWNF